jgi:hypothetical protein
MRRAAWASLAVVLLAAAGPVRAAEDWLAGNWKVLLRSQGLQHALWLVKLENKDGKWSGKVLATAPKAFGPDPVATALTDLSLSRGVLRFNLKLDTGDNFAFEGKVPDRQSDKLLGSLRVQSGLSPTELERSQLKDLDPYDVAREAILTQTGPDVLATAEALMQEAAEHKAKPEEVRSWASRGMKVATAHGPRMEREYTLQIAQLLAGQKPFHAIAVEYAHRAARQLEPQDTPGLRKRVLNTLAGVLKEAGKADEAKEIAAQADKVEVIKLTAAAPRKNGDTRTVLVELFTNAEAHNCLAAELAFDALAKTYQPSEVVLLEYNLNGERLDLNPLVNVSSRSRMTYYQNAIVGVPMLFVDGTRGTPGGGGFEAAQTKYDAYLAALKPQLGKPAKARLKVTALRKGGKIEITAEASDVAKPGETVYLRMALVQLRVNYEGGNGLKVYRHVVRALPGGAKGLPLTEATGKRSVTVDLEKLRARLDKYLDDVATEMRTQGQGFRSKDRALELKDLAVVAWVQDDAGREVRQAVQVPVTAGP